MALKDSECIFCKILAGEIPCAKVYETETCLAFLDIAPINPGHVLVLPKGHYPTLFDLPSELGCDLTEALTKVGKAVMEATGADGLNVIQNNYEAAGQMVFHTHFHLIPRYSDDGLKLWPQSGYSDQEEMGRLAEKISDRLK